MNEILQPDWDPKSDAVQRDQRAAYDEMRERCPVARSDFLEWSVFRHEDIVRVLMDPDTFSNAASRHLSVPDGMDPPEHTEYRRMIEQFFRPERVDAFEPQCREIAAKGLQSLLERDELEFIGDFAHWFAVRIQSASLGWPPEMCEPLRLWTQKNHQATFAQDRPAMAEIAREFEGYVHELLQVRRAAGAQASDDITGSLLRQQVQG
ncbi:MAG: cytochrome P450, partial [Candidatus Accumulibacter sp.]|nr:cytochrome P450 [Accumulibacter sp.]